MTDDGRLSTPTTHNAPNYHLRCPNHLNCCRTVTILRSMTRRAAVAAILRVAQRPAALLVTFLV